MKQNSEDIDLLDLFLILWRGKWVIILFTLISVTSRWAFFMLEKSNFREIPFYETSLLLEFNIFSNNENTPLLVLDQRELIGDFQKIYYSEELFNKWKSIKDQSFINYEYLTDTILIDGIIFKKKEGEKLIKFEQNNIIVKYDKISVLSEIIDYTSYINEILNSEIYSNLKEQYQILDRRVQKLYSNYPEINTYPLVNKMVAIDQYIDAIDKGKKSINIEPPTKPKNLSTLNFPVLSLINVVSFAILGSILGAFFIFFRNALLRRKVNLSNT